MIFVTVGNATQGFPRLLEAVDSLAGAGEFAGERVLMQTGNGGCRPRHCEFRAFLPPEEFDAAMGEADVIVSHGGCGTILNAVRRGKVPVVMPRRRRFGEHVNDHQLQITEALSADGRIVAVHAAADLGPAIAAARRRGATGSVPPAGESPMIDLVRAAVADLLGERAGS